MFKTDKRLLREAKSVAEDLGMPLSIYMNAQLREFVRARGASFYAPLTPNAKTARELDTIRKDIRAGRNVSPKFSTTEEMDHYLDAL